MANRQYTKDQLGNMSIAQLAQAAGGNEHGTGADGSAPTEFGAMGPMQRRNTVAGAMWFVILLIGVGLGLAWWMGAIR